MKFAQGDFDKELKTTLGAAAFTWANDDDVNTYTGDDGITTSPSRFDVDSVTGFELSGAVRIAGFSVDAEYNLFDAETVDTMATGGIFQNGETELTNWAIEGGYMFNALFEVVAGYQEQDADGYATKWKRTSVGANWFIHKHDVKLQATYRMGQDVDGIEDNDVDEFFLQAQYVF